MERAKMTGEGKKVKYGEKKKRTRKKMEQMLTF